MSERERRILKLPEILNYSICLECLVTMDGVMACGFRLIVLYRFIELNMCSGVVARYCVVTSKII